MAAPLKTRRDPGEKQQAQRCQQQEGQPQKAQMYEQLKQQFLLHIHSKASADTLGLLALWDFCCAHTPPGKDPRDALKPLGLTLCGPFDLLDREESSPECVVWNDPGLSGVQTPFAAIDTDLENAKPSKAKAAAATAAKEDFPHLPLLFAACIRHAVDAAQEASMAGASRGSSQGKQALSRGEREDLCARLLDFLPIPSASSTNASGSQRLEAIAKRVAKGAAQWAARRKKVCIAKDLSGLGVVVPYDKKADLGWRDLGYSLEGLSKKVRKLKEDGGTRTELEELLTLASIAVDEGDAGAALQLGRNFWCLDALGDKQCFLANPAKRLLGSAYTAMGQPGRSRSPPSSRGGWYRRRGPEGRNGGPRGAPSGGPPFWRGPPWEGRNPPASMDVSGAEDDPRSLLDGPMLTFKQFVLRNPDGTSQDVLNDGYKAYLEKYRAHHAARFFDENHHLGFMQEAYNPNMLREQFLRCRERAQQQARSFLQRWEEGGFRNLRLEAPVGLLADEDFLLLPNACCLQVQRVDPQINKFDILKALEKRGALYVAMVSNGGLTASRTAHVFFPTQQAADEALAQGAEFTLVRLYQDKPGEESDALREFRLKLQGPPEVGPSVRVALTPPIAATADRLNKDTERAWELIRTLDGQLDVCAADASHPLEDILDGVEDAWLRLDLMLTYLRHVHCVCYYSGKEQQQRQPEDEDDMATNGESSSSSRSVGVSQQQQLWADQLDQRLRVLLQMAARMQQNLPPPLDEQASPVIQTKWTAFCQEHTSKDAEGRYRCTLCQKLFKAPSFVHLHHRKKHERELARIINRYVPHLMRTAYMNDPNKHITLPQQRQRHRDRERERLTIRGRPPPPPPPSMFMPGGPPSRPILLPPPHMLPPHLRRQRDWDSPNGPAAAPLVSCGAER
ncbi:hypothetical protein cyc_07340 [Cyclospora cayetanensis]|uniref:C2H2-type domain-containing protein n=1 Tax=Cyclospora cayetanensis TaxID=88456 RepID=A0A1D3D4N4_9EIME|nr:hypothetical protein cyc_07340 [Cyclospora cayetanensis]